MNKQISRIPEEDARTLTCGQVISDVPSIVKELVENGIDAGADSISVILDDSGLSQITVVDNGSGVKREDAEDMCRLHYTNKIKNMSDLRGVRTYGFRGEALASLAHLSQAVSVTTRTSSDPVASVYKTDQDSSRLCYFKTSSDPQGTTITVVKPWHKLPVRREKFLRESAKHVSRLKQMLDSYALVFYKIRLQLVIKSSKRGESPLVITKSPQDTLKAALSRHHGLDVFNQCSLHCVTKESYELTMLLPTTSFTNTAVEHRMTFFVDRRPLSCSRELPKTVLSAVRAKIQQHCPLASKHPPIFIHIVCSSPSYDPNVEPNKDVLYFEDPATIYSIFHELLDQAYKETDVNTKDQQQPLSIPCQTGNSPLVEEPVSNDYRTYNMPRTSSHQMLLDIDDQVPNLLTDIIHSSNKEVSSKLGTSSSKSSQAIQPVVDTSGSHDWKFSMFDEPDELDEPTSGCSGPLHMKVPQTRETSHPEEIGETEMPHEEDFVQNQPVMNNPWTIAKMAGEYRTTKITKPRSPDKQAALSRDQLSTVSHREHLSFDNNNNFNMDHTLKKASTSRAQADHQRALLSPNDCDVANVKRNRDPLMTPPSSTLQEHSLSPVSPIEWRQGRNTSDRPRKRKKHDVSPSSASETLQTNIGDYMLRISDSSPGLSSQDLSTRSAKIYHSIPRNGVIGHSMVGRDEQLSNKGNPTKLRLDLTTDEEQVHNRKRVCTVDSAKLWAEQPISLETSFSPLARHEFADLGCMHALEHVCYLSGRMRMLKALDGDRRSIAMFITINDENHEQRMAHLRTSGFRDLKMTGNSDMLIRIW